MDLSCPICKQEGCEIGNEWRDDRRMDRLFSENCCYTYPYSVLFWKKVIMHYFVYQGATEAKIGDLLTMGMRNEFIPLGMESVLNKMIDNGDLEVLQANGNGSPSSWFALFTHWGFWNSSSDRDRIVRCTFLINKACELIEKKFCSRTDGDVFLLRRIKGEDQFRSLPVLAEAYLEDHSPSLKEESSQAAAFLAKLSENGLHQFGQFAEEKGFGEVKTYKSYRFLCIGDEKVEAKMALCVCDLSLNELNKRMAVVEKNRDVCKEEIKLMLKNGQKELARESKSRVLMQINEEYKKLSKQILSVMSQRQAIVDSKVNKEMYEITKNVASALQRNTMDVDEVESVVNDLEGFHSTVAEAQKVLCPQQASEEDVELEGMLDSLVGENVKAELPSVPVMEQLNWFVCL